MKVPIKISAFIEVDIKLYELLTAISVVTGKSIVTQDFVVAIVDLARSMDDGLLEDAALDLNGKMQMAGISSLDLDAIVNPKNRNHEGNA